MNVGSVAKLLDLPKETIRYYETIGLVVADRLSNRYRSYNGAHIRKLRFVQKARELGFSLKECRELFSLYENDKRSDADIKAHVESRLNDVQ